MGSYIRVVDRRWLLAASSSENGAGAVKYFPIVSPGSTIPSNLSPTAAVPVATAPTYTMEQIAKAGAELLSKDPNMRDIVGGTGGV